MAASVSKRLRQVRRGASSLSRIVPNAPWMSPEWVSSTTEVGTGWESPLTGPRSATEGQTPLLASTRLRQFSGTSASSTSSTEMAPTRFDEVSVTARAVRL